MADAACPVCGAPRHDRFRPFCSRRCADLDLVKWLRGDYAAPGESVTDAGRDDPKDRE